MKVVILSAFYEPYMSGAEQMVKQLLEKLDSSFKLVLVTARFDRKLPKTERHQNFLIYRVGLGHKKLDKFLFPFLAAWKVRQLKPHLVHAVMESYAGGALFLVKYFYPPARRLLTLQSGDLDAEHKQKQFWLRLFWKAIHFSPHKITAISNYLAERAHNLGVSTEKILVIPNGVDLSEIPRNISKIAYRVVCVARLSWEKGLDDLINAWGKVILEFPQAELFMVGEGPERSKLEQLIFKKDLGRNIALLGRLDHKRTLEILSSASVFVCPSLAEGLGIAFIEAQACGVPVVGTRVGGIPDVVEDGVSGILVPPRSSETLAKAITLLLKDSNLAGRLKVKAQSRLDRYLWPKIVGQFADLYKKL